MPHAAQDTVPHALSSDTPSWYTPESDGSNNTGQNHSVFEEDQTPTHECNANIQGCNPIQGPNDFDLLPSHTDPAQAGVENYYAHTPHHMPSTPAHSQPFSITSASVHAPVSRCPRTRDLHYRILIDSEVCDLCGASKAHYLATIANTVPKQALFEKLYSDIPDINTSDTGQNTPLHFLASLGPMPDRIQIFQKAGANLLSKNVNGDTFLHVLDPSKLEGKDLLDLLDWCVAKGLDLKQRNYDGKTILHCLIDQNPRSHDWIYVLTTLQSTRKPAAARDSSNSSIADIPRARGSSCSPIAAYLLARDNRGLNILDIVRAKRDTSYLEAVRHFFPISELSHSTGSTVATTNLLSGNNHDDIMRSTLSLAATDPLATNPGDGKNALSCLAHIVHLCPEYETDLRPLLARENHLRKCLKNGVDPNGYDRLGSPPLHHFLSTFRHNESDDKTADLISLLVFHGADVNMRNSEDESALHVACKLGRISCVKKLLTFKADVQALDCRGDGIISSARLWMMSSDPETASRIQECIDLVSYAPNIHWGQKTMQP